MGYASHLLMRGGRKRKGERRRQAKNNLCVARLDPPFFRLLCLPAILPRCPHFYAFDFHGIFTPRLFDLHCTHHLSLCAYFSYLRFCTTAFLLIFLLPFSAPPLVRWAIYSLLLCHTAPFLASAPRTHDHTHIFCTLLPRTLHTVHCLCTLHFYILYTAHRHCTRTAHFREISSHYAGSPLVLHAFHAFCALALHSAIPLLGLLSTAIACCAPHSAASLRTQRSLRTALTSAHARASSRSSRSAHSPLRVLGSARAIVAACARARASAIAHRAHRTLTHCWFSGATALRALIIVFRTSPHRVIARAAHCTVLPARCAHALAPAQRWFGIAHRSPRSWAGGLHASLHRTCTFYHHFSCGPPAPPAFPFPPVFNA